MISLILNKKTLDKLRLPIIIIVSLIVGISIGNILTPKKDVAYEQSLEGQINNEKVQAIEWMKKATNAQKREKLWLSIEMQYKDSLERSRKETSKWIKIYANIKNTPTPKYTEPQLDSIISAII